ncbi:hypothetical protein T265_06503 [Opisthorchis viverrini]|uniref:Uncharacterized protein n=1 Tax=Opisthorchis viverrini TaxID=6198 RepID=A0A074ZS97_OPIVI|nr:hypothetical protein T265_06503 [Opisthorchis viverrini]KER26225.1 hypothetical protein T265_06503 [Opisthorchis viverrini]
MSKTLLKAGASVCNTTQPTSSIHWVSDRTVFCLKLGDRFFPIVTTAPPDAPSDTSRKAGKLKVQKCWKRSQAVPLDLSVGPRRLLFNETMVDHNDSDLQQRGPLGTMHQTKIQLATDYLQSGLLAFNKSKPNSIRWAVGQHERVMLSLNSLGPATEGPWFEPSLSDSTAPVEDWTTWWYVSPRASLGWFGNWALKGQGCKQKNKRGGRGDVVQAHHNHSKVPTPPNIHSGWGLEHVATCSVEMVMHLHFPPNTAALRLGF